MAKAFLRTIPSSSAEQIRYEAMEEIIRQCIPGVDWSKTGNARRARGTLTLSLSSEELRGALAEAFLHQRFKTLGSNEVAHIALGDDGMYFAEKYHGARSPSTERSFGLGFAGCVAGNNPDKTVALLQTMPGGPEERAAIVDMSSSFGNCVMDGQKLSIDPPMLRNQIAEVTYYAVMGGE